MAFCIMCLIVFLGKAIIKSLAYVTEKNVYASINPDESRKEGKKNLPSFEKDTKSRIKKELLCRWDLKSCYPLIFEGRIPQAKVETLRRVT